MGNALLLKLPVTKPDTETTPPQVGGGFVGSHQIRPSLGDSENPGEELLQKFVTKVNLAKAG